MENQINIDEQNTQQIGQSQINQRNPADSKEQNVQVNSQSIAQPVNLPNKFKFSIKTLWVALSCSFILAAVIVFFWIKQRYANQPPNLTPTTQAPSPTTVVSSGQLEWLTYKDDNVEFKYPKEWILSQKDPSNIGIICNDGLYFFNPDYTDVILLIERYQSPLQPSSLNTCAATNTISYSFSRRQSDRELKLRGKSEKVHLDPVAINNDKYIIQSYGFESDFTTIDVYNFFLIYSQGFSSDIQSIFESIFDNVLSSFRYLKQYQVTEPTEWKTYSSKLGYSFEYPEEWGEVKENITDYGNNPNKDISGKSYLLTFSLKSYVASQWKAWGGGLSSDFISILPSGYKGDPKSPPSVTSEIIIGLVHRCPYYIPLLHDSYRGEVRFNLPEKEINGVTINVPILSLSDIEQYEKIIKDFIDKEESCKKQGSDASQSPVAIAKEKEILDMINKRENLDQESQINLKIFEHISKSAKIL